jgi:predicted CXXCH cytochrome family protein
MNIKTTLKMRGGENNMKKTLILSLVILLTLGIAYIANAGISGTKHDLSSTGSGTIKASAGQQGDEICIWCHTPHAANSAMLGAPLWNKATPASSYTMYGTTVAGNATDATPSASAKACLSCHDGVAGVNSLINATDGYAASGTLVAFGATPAGTAKIIPTSSAANLGITLADDHPISITYAVGDAGLRATSYALTSWLGATTIADTLRSGKVECSSCHDVHNNTKGTFLRKANASSALCIDCHDR